MIQVRIRKSFPPRPDSAGFSLDIEMRASSGLSVLYGPSGAGKTMTLDAIAGFVKPDEGRILVGDEILFDGGSRINLPPRSRRCGYVPRGHALLPHMTLRQNLTFAAACRRLPRLERHRKVSEILERFRLSEVSGRRLNELSESEAQRCSIARALIGQPKLLLLDQPARRLDAPLRSNLHDLLRQVGAEFGIPILLVAQDMDECFELSEEMFVVQAGRLLQSGPPRQVLDQPASVEVARLVGSFNLLPAEITALDPAKRTSRLRLGPVELAGPYFPGRLLGDRVTLCVRPEELRAFAPAGRPGSNQVAVQLVRVTQRPQTVRLHFSGGIMAELADAEFDKLKHHKDWIVEFPPQCLRAL
jgi:molybdate transport system ATP-binding protein